MLIGAHVSTRGGIVTAIDRALAIGAEVFQTHPTSAQMWRHLNLTPEVREEFLAAYRASGLRGHYLHAIYLINLATPKEMHRQQSIESLLHYMNLAAELDAGGVVFHPGSHLGAGFKTMLPQITAAMKQIVDRAPHHHAKLLVENSAGSGGCVGCNLEDLHDIMAQVDSPRVGVCFDTQHAFASGYEMRDDESVHHLRAEIQRTIGFDRIHLVHANDSRRPLGSNVDRHTNIGEGEIGENAFRLLLAQPEFRNVPWLLEVPGVERTGPNLQQINLLRDCAGLQPVAPQPLAVV